MTWLVKQVSLTMLRAPFILIVNGNVITDGFDTKESFLRFIEDKAKNGRVLITFKKKVRPETKHTRAHFRYAGSVTV